jgi:hypothetical protein
VKKGTGATDAAGFVQKSAEPVADIPLSARTGKESVPEGRMSKGFGPVERR